MKKINQLGSIMIVGLLLIVIAGLLFGLLLTNSQNSDEANSEQSSQQISIEPTEDSEEFTLSVDIQEYLEEIRRQSATDEAPKLPSEYKCADVAAIDEPPDQYSCVDFPIIYEDVKQKPILLPIPDPCDWNFVLKDETERIYCLDDNNRPIEIEQLIDDPSLDVIEEEFNREEDL